MSDYSKVKCNECKFVYHEGDNNFLITKCLSCGSDDLNYPYVEEKGDILIDAYEQQILMHNNPRRWEVLSS